MTVMGEASPAAWSDELRRAGRVVFPLRPGPVRKGLCAMWVGFALLQLFHWYTPYSRGAARVVVVTLEVIAVASVTAWYSWRLRNQYPILTVTYAGIQRGRREVLTWEEIGTIGFVHRWRGRQILPIVRKDLRGKDFIVDDMAVKDIPALAGWLEDLLRQRRDVNRR
jgi:hypothetical protein